MQLIDGNISLFSKNTCLITLAKKWTLFGSPKSVHNDPKSVPALDTFWVVIFKQPLI